MQVIESVKIVYSNTWRDITIWETKDGYFMVKCLLCEKSLLELGDVFNKFLQQFMQEEKGE